MFSLLQNGAEIRENYLSPSHCELLLRDIEVYKASNELPLIERLDAGRSLRYRVIDGDRIFDSLPRVVSLYRGVLALVRRREPQLEPLSNQTACLNINFTPPGGEYRWHYDRNSVTAILFLNSVKGGETEMYPALSGLPRQLERHGRSAALRQRSSPLYPVCAATCR
jgi:hypothetical protein